MTYLEELNDSLSTDHHFVPFICNPTHLDFDKKIFDQFGTMYRIKKINRLL